MAYTYEKQLWKDYPDTTTPVTAERLNHMEDGISEAAKSGGGDTIPVGSEFDYDGTTVPEGYQQVDNPNGKILWTNPNPANTFNAQTIELKDNDCDIFEIYYKQLATQSNILSTKLIKNHSGLLYSTNASSSTGVRSRNVDYLDNASLSFANAYISNGGSGGAVNNDVLIPLYIVGYKTGLFN